jgi:hypothetical protein
VPAGLRDVAALSRVLEHCELPLDVTRLLSRPHLSADEGHGLYRQEKSGTSDYSRGQYHAQVRAPSLGAPRVQPFLVVVERQRLDEEDGPARHPGGV